MVLSGEGMIWRDFVTKFLSLMFGAKKNDGDTISAKSSNAGGLAVNLLAGGTQFEGKVNSEADFRIDGHFKGDLICMAKVIIGPSGHFEGNIQCVNGVIEGNFRGNIQVKELLEVRENGKLTGHVRTGRLSVQGGAIFDVQCSMGGNTVKVESLPPKEISAHTGTSTAKEAALVR